MLSLCKLATPIVNTAIKSSARTIYTANFLRLDAFKEYSEKVEKQNAHNSNAVKQAIKDAVTKPEGKLFTEDIKLYLYQTKTDDEINTLVEAIKKYRSQSSLSLFSFNFDSPLMRLLYTLNKTDQAVNLYMNEEFFNKSQNVTIMLLNKLVEEKKFEEVLKVFNKYLQNLANAKQDPTNKNLVNRESIRLITEALLEKNDASALEQAKSIFKQVSELKSEIPVGSIMHVIALALDQKQPDLAFELLDRIIKPLPVKSNLKILTLAALNRVEEALKEAEELSKMPDERQNRTNTRSLFFTTTLEKLSQATESNPQLKTRAQTLMDTTASKGQYFNLDLKQYLTRPIDKRPIGLQQQNRQGSQDRRPFDSTRRLQNQGSRNPQGQQQRQQRQQQNRPQQQQQKFDKPQQRAFIDRRPQKNVTAQE